MTEIFRAGVARIAVRLQKFASGSASKPVPGEQPLSAESKQSKPLPSGLEETIATYKAHFGQRWQEAFFATAKISVCVEKERKLMNETVRSQGISEFLEQDRGVASSALFPTKDQLRRVLSWPPPTQPHHLTLARSIREILSRTAREQLSESKENVADHIKSAKD